MQNADDPNKNQQEKTAIEVKQTSELRTTPKTNTIGARLDKEMQAAKRNAQVIFLLYLTDFTFKPKKKARNINRKSHYLSSLILLGLELELRLFRSILLDELTVNKWIVSS